MNVVELREFYASPLGKATHRLVCPKLLPMLAQPADATILGLGFAIPYLNEANRNLAFMTARRGVIHWPEQGLVQSALVDELDLPLPDNSVDLALVVHGLEFTDSPLEMLQELWRVVAPQGKLVLVVPNRRGLWSASEASPFGYGQPFSRTQLSGLLKEAQFSYSRMEPALFMPPRAKLAGLKLAMGIEKFGRTAFGGFSGIIMVEATKQVYAYSAGRRVKRSLPRFRPVFLPTHRQGDSA
jgi:SAM-dependent methyltransferase